MNLRKIIFVFLYTLTGEAVLDAAEATTRPIAYDAFQYYKAASGIMDKQCGPFGFFNCFDSRCSCYLLLPSKNFYNESSKYCQHFQGQLTTLSSQEESEFVASLLKRSDIPDTWIGLNRSDSSAEFGWVDKSTVSYSALKNDGQAGQGNCVRLTSQNYWLPFDCTKTAAPFVCEVPYESTNQEAACRLGWAKFDNHCYQLHKNKRTWDDAQEHCKSLGSHLVSIHSYEERAVTREMMWRSGVSDLWIGLRLDLQSKEFYWVDGTVKNFIDWKPNRPDILQNDAECAEVRNYDRRWNDVPCSEKLSYICKMNVNQKKA